MSIRPTATPASASTEVGNTAAQPSPVALFVSDVHLQESLPHTSEAFFRFLQEHASKAQALYLLGDLFEYWAGDDDLVTPFNRDVADALRKLGESGVSIFWIAGNRDFLVGKDFAQEAGISLLPDPFVANIANLRIVLSHGDVLCTDDTSYMAFRNLVRTPEWQQTFLSKPLEERKNIIAGLRKGSKEAQQGKAAYIMDANPHAVSDLFRQSGTHIMIHGHTHRPARHENLEEGVQLTRWVLPDWDCDDEPKRGGWLCIDATGQVHRYNVEGMKLD